MCTPWAACREEELAESGTLAWVQCVHQGHVSLLIPQALPLRASRGGSWLSGTLQTMGQQTWVGVEAKERQGQGRGERQRVRLSKYLLI